MTYDANREGAQDPGDEPNILEKLKAQGYEIANDPNAPPTPSEGEPAKPESPPEEPPQEPATTPKEGEEPDEKFVPGWKYMQQKKKVEDAAEREQGLAAKIKEQEDEINKLKTKAPETPQPSQDDDADVRELINEGIDEQSAKVVAKFVRSKTTLLEQKIKEVDEIKQKLSNQDQQSAFNTTFEQDIMPLVKAEYPDASEATLSRIKTSLHGLRETEQFRNTPLDVIYRGIEDFRALAPKGRRSAEPSRMGGGRAEHHDLDNVTDEEYARMSPENRAKFVDYQRKKEARGR